MITPGILFRIHFCLFFNSPICDCTINPFVYFLQSSQDTDGGTSMARHLLQVADSGAQDNDKFPSYIYNHNDSLTNKSTKMDDLDEEKNVNRSSAPSDDDNIPTDDAIPASSDLPQRFEVVENYKRTWGIPLLCKLVGGGESTLNSNNTGPISNSANNNSPSSGTGGTNNNNSSNWPAGHNPATAGVGGNAWNSVGNGSNAGGRQQVGSNTPSNNASHPSNTSQNTGMCNWQFWTFLFRSVDGL